MEISKSGQQYILDVLFEIAGREAGVEITAELINNEKGVSA